MPTLKTIPLLTILNISAKKIGHQVEKTFLFRLIKVTYGI
jgi:hypothetical protein